ncbi:MAG: sarcosine oxidase subunit gamma [Microbacteriaceae bacterium]|nr:sarcosine oxidase subunit gamma [Microbacteriaceae bacterium]
MVEAVLLRSPLGEWAERFAAIPAAIALVEKPFQTMVNLRVRPGAPATAVENALGFALPHTPSPHTASVDGNGDRALWLAPDEFLIISENRPASHLVDLLRAALGSTEYGAAVDVSAQYTTVGLRGTETRDLLAGGCSTDFSVEAAPTGTCVHSPLAQASVVIIVTDAANGSFDLIVRSSFARYLAAWLISAAQEYAEHGSPARVSARESV